MWTGNAKRKSGYWDLSSATVSTKGVGAGTIEIGPVSEMHIFLICVKGINLMKKNAYFIEIALKLSEPRGRIT